jgi:MoaA/NifB/PqqE/SkfB family radical SAM enzyme
MAKVAVVFPPLRVSRDFVDYPFFADLGALSAAAVLEQAGHSVAVLDALAAPGAAVDLAEPDWVTLGATVGGDRLPEAEVYVVAHTPFHRPPAREPLLGALLESIAARSPRSPIVLAELYQSGQHYVDVPGERLLAAYPEARALLRYEGDASIPGLVGRVLDDPGGTPEVVLGREAPELDALPLPAWSAVDVGARFQLHGQLMRSLGRPSWAFPISGGSLPLITSRGCPYRCIHCSSNPGLPSGQPKRQRRHSREGMARRLDQLLQLGARRVHVLDELVNASERHFDALLELCRERGLLLEIPNGLRADHLRRDQVESLRGRVTTLSISAESGAQRVVTEVVRKDLDLSNVRRVAEDAARAGVPLLVHFMIGLPGETREEINQTLDFAIALHQEHAALPSVQYATPVPGTELARQTTGLPVVSDYGPCFQTRASPTNQEASPEDLARFKQTFELRLAAMAGPKKAILNVTYKCNNRCTFCAVGTRTQLDGDFERQRELLDRYRARGVTLLDLDGGEPTLYPSLFALIRYARSIGYTKVNVTTNGRMAFYPDYAQRLVASGVTSILFSLHGATRHVHAANVGVPEAFDQTVGGIRNVVGAAPPGLELGANITLTLSNHRHLPDVAALVCELGLRWLNIQFLTPFGRATETVAPDTRAAAEIVMRVIDDWRERMKLQVINLPWCFLPGYEDFVVGDLAKLERHMLFVNNEQVNLFEYLGTQRTYEPECATCTRKVFCGGFYRMSDVPEPEWLMEPGDPSRPLVPSR